MATPSNQTIYIKNLNEKVRKTDLKKALYCLFSNYGPILDIVAHKTQSMRGQAFIVLRDPIAATNAMRELQNYEFFGKPMVIQYAKTKSDVVSKTDGTFVPRIKKKKVEDNDGSEEEKETKKTRGKKRKAEDPVIKEEKRNTNQPRSRSQALPNKTLFVQNLPEDCTDIMLINLFQQFPGFSEVRLVPGKKGLAFVEFQNEMQSNVAMAELQGSRITHDRAIQISFQKRM